MDRRLGKLVAIGALFTFTDLAIADTYKCLQPEGKVIYQNWPCGTKPDVERRQPAKPDYGKVVACGMANGLVGTTAAVRGDKQQPKDCSK